MSAHLAPKHMHTHTHTPKCNKPTVYLLVWLPPQSKQPLPLVSSNASCPQVELFPRSQRCTWFHFQEVWWEVSCAAALRGRRSLLVSGHCFFCLLIIKNGLHLHILAEECLSGRTVPDRLVRLSRGRPPLAWAPGPEGRMSSLHNMQCATLCKSFCLLDLCLSHLKNGYHDSNIHPEGQLELEQASRVDLFCKLHTIV